MSGRFDLYSEKSEKEIQGWVKEAKEKYESKLSEEQLRKLIVIANAMYIKLDKWKGSARELNKIIKLSKSAPSQDQRDTIASLTQDNEDFIEAMAAREEAMENEK